MGTITIEQDKVDADLQVAVHEAESNVQVFESNQSSLEIDSTVEVLKASEVTYTQTTIEGQVSTISVDTDSARTIFECDATILSIEASHTIKDINASADLEYSAVVSNPQDIEAVGTTILTKSIDGTLAVTFDAASDIDPIIVVSNQPAAPILGLFLGYFADNYVEVDYTVED